MRKLRKRELELAVRRSALSLHGGLVVAGKGQREAVVFEQQENGIGADDGTEDHDQDYDQEGGDEEGGGEESGGEEGWGEEGGVGGDWGISASPASFTSDSLNVAAFEFSSPSSAKLAARRYPLIDKVSGY
jgi:hypothetical protein